MEPTELLEVITDDNDYVVEIRGSQELLDKCADQFVGAKRTVKEPEMFSLKLPELEDES